MSDLLVDALADALQARRDFPAACVGETLGEWGWVSEGWRGGGARVQAVRLAGDGPPKAPRDNV